MTNEFDEINGRENGYRYTSGDELPRDDYQPARDYRPMRDYQPIDGSGYAAPTRTPEPAVEEPPKKKLFQRTWARVTALLLAVAVLAGGAGYAGAAIRNGSRTDRTARAPATR